MEQTQTINSSHSPESVVSRLYQLAVDHNRTEVAEYQGQLHIRTGRRVVAVVDIVDGNVRINEATTPEQVARVNDVLEILGCDRRAGVLEVEVPGSPGVTASAPVWIDPGVNEYAQPVTVPRVPRTVYTFAFIGSPAAEWYGVDDVDDDGAPITTPQPAQCWVQDNLRDIEEEVANG